eukprot:c33813_g1_i1.p1 GENE.c33813_g1_i1~~c33813_g1_i1.p1  ORF type:complete len:369 (+),score=60.96 c33813_g1_i1:723-1829(+)
MGESDLQTISEKIEATLTQFALCGASPDYAKQVIGEGSLKRLVELTVWLSGRHFRTLEEGVQTLFAHLVSEEAYQLACGQYPLAGHVDFRLRLKPNVVLTNINVWEVIRHFLERAAEGPSAGGNQCYFETLRWFLTLMLEPETTVNETEVQKLEDLGAVFVKARSQENLNLVVPRVNLPFLYMYSRILRPMALNLAGLIPGMLSDVVVDLNRPTKELPRAFERVMLRIELIRTHALATVKLLECVQFNQVLPGLILCPWDEAPEELFMAPWLLSSEPIRVSESPKQNVGASELCDLLIQRAVASVQGSKRVVCFTVGEKTSKTIEYCACHVVRANQDSETMAPVLLLCSMKLRESQYAESCWTCEGNS